MMKRLDLEGLSGPCSCGQEHHVTVRGIWIEPDALRHLPGILEQNQWKEAAILCDTNTVEAAGRDVSRLLPRADLVILNAEGLHADEHAVAAAQERIAAQTEVLVAVGSGTIHDTARFVAHHRGIPFIAVPTAASVDGFVSSVAAMTWEGCKKTFPACAPDYVVADSRVIAQAPQRLTAAGVGDLLGKYCSLTDWKLAHLLTGESYCERIASLEMDAIQQVVDHLSDIRAGGEESCTALLWALLLSGLAMQMQGNSRPASGAEHHLSHLWEMECLNPALDALHGEKVGVGTLLCARAYHAFAERLRAGALHPAKRVPSPAEEVHHFCTDAEQAQGLLDENRHDPLTGLSSADILRNQREILTILDALPDEDMLCGLLEQSGGRCTLPSIGLGEEIRESSLRNAPYVRQRLTLLRLGKLFERPWEPIE